MYVGDGSGPSGLTVEHVHLSKHSVWSGVSPQSLYRLCCAQSSTS